MRAAVQAIKAKGFRGFRAPSKKARAKKAQARKARAQHSQGRAPPG